MKLILGIDPGIAKTGWCLISVQNRCLACVDSGVVKASKSWALPTRLKHIYNLLDEIVKKFQPDFCVLERIFVNKNPGSSLNFAYARGAILVCLALNNRTVEEISPNSVKKAITNNGHATKEQVRYMVNKTLNQELEFKDFDQYDAAALAICKAILM